MRWAVSSGCEMCLKQPRFNKVLAIIVLREQKQLGDLCIGAPTTLELHPDENFFWQILLPSWGERYVKKPKFNNARAIIVLAEQNSWSTGGSLRQRLKSNVTAWIFCQILLPWWGERYVKKPTVQQYTCRYCPNDSRAAPRREFFLTKFCHLAS